MLKQYNGELPPSVAALVHEIEANADRLMPFMSNNGDLDPTIWPSPDPREQSDWIQVCAFGGRLLHCQGCIVAIGQSSEEWLMGRLFVSDRGVGIQGSSGACLGTFEVALWTGLLAWQNIEAMELGNSEISLYLVKGSSFRDNTLRLQLGAEKDFERLKQAWEHYVVMEPPPKFFSFATASRATFSMEDGIGPLNGSRISARHSCSSHIKADAPFTTSFVHATNALPESMQYNQPLISERLPDVSLDAMRRILQKDDDWFMCRFQIDVLKASEIRATPWTPAQVVPGTMVRRLNFKLPKPDDIPKAVANVIGFPDILESALAARLKCEDDTLTLHMHSCAFNAPYGDHQRLEDVLVFRADGEGGISVSKFMRIVWVKAMPWTLNMVKGVFESKVKADGTSTFSQFLGLIRNEASKLSAVVA